MKYYTRPEVSEKLNTSTVTIANYIKELQETLNKKEYEEAFNSRNQPNDKGIKLLEALQKEKNPNSRFIDSIEDLEAELLALEAEKNEEISEIKIEYELELKTLKEENEALRKDKEEMNDKFMDLYKDTNDKLTELIHQSNTIAASLALANQKIEELESKTIETKTYESSYEEPEEKKSFFQKLFGK
jgi:DNA repair exonuclease SbcCD ATPase subunit